MGVIERQPVFGNADVALPGSKAVKLDVYFLRRLFRLHGGNTAAYSEVRASRMRRASRKNEIYEWRRVLSDISELPFPRPPSRTMENQTPPGYRIWRTPGNPTFLRTLRLKHIPLASRLRNLTMFTSCEFSHTALTRIHYSLFWKQDPRILSHLLPKRCGLNASRNSLV